MSGAIGGRTSQCNYAIELGIFPLVNLIRCKHCGRLVLAGWVALHAMAHPFDQHDHVRAAGEGLPILGRVAVSSATTQQASIVPFISTSLDRP